MKLKRKTVIMTACWVILIGCFVVAIWYDETVVQPKHAAARETLSIAERYGLTPVCINGVEYWMNPGAHSRSWMLSPKFSPYNSAPDTCEE